MLDTRFPRIVGDVGNPDSFPFPVSYRIVKGATPEAIVRGDQTKFAESFVAAGRQLVAEGCDALATTCGFLTLMRNEITERCGVPVVSSALEQVPGLIKQGKFPGVLTISREDLGPDHLAVAGVPESVPIEGLEGGHFATQILGNADTFDASLCEHEMVRGAVRLCHLSPNVDSIVLECTNIPPYAAAIQRATGRNVYSILTAVSDLHQSVTARKTAPVS